MPNDVRIDRAFAKANAAAQKRDTESRRASTERASALDRADRREWSHKRLGDEHRWPETVERARSSSTRRFVYDPAQGEVIEVSS